MYRILNRAVGNTVINSTDRMEFLVDGVGDLPNLPEACIPGSIAYTATLEEMWQKDNYGKWKKIGGDT